MNRYVKYGLRIAGIMLGIFLLIYASIYLYVSFHKKAIISQVREMLEARIKGDVTIGNIDLDFFRHFPQVSVYMTSVSVKDSLYAEHRHPFFEAQQIFLRLNIIRLIRKKDPLTGLRVENGALYLFTDTAGRSNRYLFAGKKDTSASGNANEPGLKDIILKSFRIRMENQRFQKLIDLDVISFACGIKHGEDVLQLYVRNRIFIHQLGFNLAKGSYLKEKTLEGNYTLYFHKAEKVLDFKKIPVIIQGHPFRLDGQFHFTRPSAYTFTVSTSSIDASFAGSLLTPKIARSIGKIALDKPVKASATLTGSFQPGEPLVHVQFETSGNNVQTPLASFTNSSFSGHYTNELAPGLSRTDENSAIEVHAFKGRLEGIELRADTIRFNNLLQPLLICDLKSDFDLTTLNNLLESNAFQLKRGRGRLDIHYKGPLPDTIQQTPNVHGTLLLQHGKLLYGPRNITMEDCNGIISFSGADASIVDMRCTIGDNKIMMNGRIAQLLTLIKSDPAKIGLNWNVSSPSLNLETFTGLLQARSPAVYVNGRKQSRFAKIASQIDKMMDQATIDLDLKAGKLRYRRFTASDVKASIHLDKESWTLKKVSCQHAGGTLALSGLISPNGNSHLAAIKAQLNNIDIRRLMYAFNDFGQRGITSDNLQGKLTAAADVQMLLKRNDAVTVSHMQGTIDFSLKQGALLNYEPMRNLQSFFGNRDMDHIYFAELKDQLNIKDKDITINKMEIQSTALSAVVQGVYSLRGNTNITIQVPLSNLKKRKEAYMPVNKGADAKRGMSIFLRGKPDKDGKIRFKYDPFKKFRKKDSAVARPE